MNTQLLTVPLKTTEESDWTGPLRSYIERYFGTEFNESISQFSKLRSDIRHANKDLVGRDMYYKYYGQLELLELRVPAGAASLNIKFNWHDAFKPATAISQSSMAYEKASILFNLGAILSHIGNDSLDNNDFKTSYQSFQNAAGIYEFISLNFLKAPTDDLNPKTVKALQKLMLAQAQEVFVLNLITSNSPNLSLISKLCKATYQFYKMSKELFENDVKNIDRTWIPFIGLKELYYHSLSYYYQAKHNSNATKYGLAIAYMKQAESILNSSRSKYQVMANSKKLSELIKTHLEMVSSDIKIFEKDNDLIYHDTIPLTNALPEIKPLESVKSIPINEQDISKAVGKDLFEKIIPMNVSTQSSMYSEEQAILLRGERDKCDIADEEFKSTLEFLKLPKSLTDLQELIDDGFEKKITANGSSNSDLDDDDEIDARVLSMAMEMNQTPVSDLKNNDIRLQIFECLTNSEKLLQENEFEDNQNRLKFAIPVQLSNESQAIRQMIQSYRKTFVESEVSDNKLKSTIEPFKREIALMSLGPNDPTFLNSFKIQRKDNEDASLSQQVSLLDIDDFSKSSSKDLKEKLDKINSKLQELRYLQKERENTYQDLKEAVHKDDITNILVLNTESKELDQLFAKELLKFSSYQERISMTIDKQTSLINLLKSKMSEVLDDPLIKKNTKLKNESISTKLNMTNRCLKSYESWKIYKSGVLEGRKFYTQLISLAQSLLDRTNNYIRDYNFTVSRLKSEHRSSSTQFGSVSSIGQSPRSSISQQQQQQQQQQPPIPQHPSYSSSSSSYQQQAPPPQYQAQPPHVNSYYQQQPQVNSYQSQPPQVNSYQSQPPLPRHPSASTGSAPPIPSFPASQQQQQQQGTDFYSTKSAYDPSMYSSFNQYSNQGR